MRPKVIQHSLLLFRYAFFVCLFAVKIQDEGVAVVNAHQVSAEIG